MFQLARGLLQQSAHRITRFPKHSQLTQTSLLGICKKPHTTITMDNIECESASVVEEPVDYTGMTSAEIRREKLLRFNRTSESNHELIKEALTEDDRKEMAEVVDKQGAPMTKYWSDKLDHLAAQYWNKFYLNNQQNFFKDRHYLHREMPWLIDANDAYEAGTDTKQPVLLEVGCGVGNTIYPLLADFPRTKILACDFAASAIDLVKKHENYDPDRVDAHVVDISKQRLPFATGSASFATLVYVMSALNPRDMMFALREVRRVLSDDGILLFRDYAVGDLTMLRFKKGAKIGERFYKRGDGTRTYFFERAELMGMLREAGFLVEDDDALYIKKIIENRKKDLKMKRIWLQCKVKADPNYVPVDVPVDAPAQVTDAALASSSTSAAAADVHAAGVLEPSSTSTTATTTATAAAGAGVGASVAEAAGVAVVEDEEQVAKRAKVE